MFTVTEAVSIACSPEDAFAFLADGHNRPRWDTSVISEKLTSPEPIGVGSTLHTKMRAVGREIDFDWRVTEFEVPKRMATASTAGPLPTTVLLEFIAEGADCRVRATIEGDTPGMMRLVEPLIAEAVRTTLSGGLARAKSLLEAQTVT